MSPVLAFLSDRLWEFRHRESLRRARARDMNAAFLVQAVDRRWHQAVDRRWHQARRVRFYLSAGNGPR